MIGKTESAIKRMARRNGRVPVHRTAPSHSAIREICKSLYDSGYFVRRIVHNYTIYYYPVDSNKN